MVEVLFQLYVYNVTKTILRGLCEAGGGLWDFLEKTNWFLDTLIIGEVKKYGYGNDYLTSHDT